MVFPNTSSDEAKELAERVRIAIYDNRPQHNDHALPPISVSIGVAMLAAGESFADVFAAADNAPIRQYTLHTEPVRQVDNKCERRG